MFFDSLALVTFLGHEAVKLRALFRRCTSRGQRRMLRVAEDPGAITWYNFSEPWKPPKSSTVQSASSASSCLTAIARLSGLRWSSQPPFLSFLLLSVGALASTQSGIIPNKNRCLQNLPSPHGGESCVAVPGSWSCCFITVTVMRHLPRCPRGEGSKVFKLAVIASVGVSSRTSHSPSGYFT